MKKIKAISVSVLTAFAFSYPFLSQAEEMQGMNMGDMHGNKSSHVETFPFGHPGKSNEVTRVIKITALDFKYEPSSISVKSGETIKFIITNKGKVDHEFVLGTITEQKEHDKEMLDHPHMKVDDPNGVSIPKGKSESLIWTFTKPMTIQYACHIPGHYAAGMFGNMQIK